MRLTTPIIVVAMYAIIGVTSQRRAKSPVQPRQWKSCEETDGPESIRCGGRDSAFCYNPSHGQSCCEIDHGYCEKGRSCAPVAGYCCIEGEDPETCAKHSGFSVSAVSKDRNANGTLPRPLRPILNMPPAFRALEAENVLKGPEPVIPQTAASGTIPPGDGSMHSGLQNVLADSVPPVPNANGPQIQVSVAKKEQWRLLLMGVAIGAVGIFMSSC
ncbi:hypothetical protein GQ53DRAFT_158361 [Thozetella sp. PMI_491]|nr:hypothetical protein GQ53DRAFT_158361 [Thozetella sp. PMI_491]